MAKQNIDDLAVVISATNEMAGGLQSALRDVQNFAKKISSTLGDFGMERAAARDTAAAKRQTESFASSARKSLASVGDVGRTSFGVVGRAAGGAASAIGGFASRTAATAAGLALYEAGVQGITGAITYLREAVRDAADLESLTTGFEVLLKSGTAAKDMIGDLRAFAAKTPFNTKELTDAARSMLAYGVAADQIVPTIKMLGDVSAGFWKDLPISRLAYLYGTAFAQQRLYTVDVKQFAQAGIPIWEELGKVMGKSTHELHGMVEEGRIGRDEMTKAFVSMTREGGRFAGMTERLGESFAGTWEQMTDAFQLVKLKVGQVLIDGLGLKEAFKDLGAFANRVEQGLERVKPFVSFLGDLGRAVAQVGYEFAKAAPQIGEIFVRQLDTVVPEARAAANRLHEIIKDAANFKLDPVKVAEFGVEAGKSIISAGIVLVDVIGTAANAFSDGFIKPMVKAAEHLGWLFGRMRAGANFLNENFNPFEQSKIDKVNEMRFGFQYPTADMNGEEIVRNFKQLRQEIEALEAKPEGNLRRAFSLGEAYRAQQRFFEMFPFDANAREKLLAGQAPDLNAKAPDLLQNFTTEGLVKAMKERLGDLDEVGRQIVENTRLEQQRTAQLKQEAEWLGKVDSAKAMVARRNATGREVAGGGLGGLAVPLDPFTALAGSMTELSRVQDRERAGLLSQFLPAPFNNLLGERGGVRLMNDVPSHLLDLAKQLKEEYRPLNVGPGLSVEDALKGTALGQRKGDLDDLLKRGLIDQGVHEQAWGAAVRGVADKLGIGGPARLPDAAMKDTTESVRVLNQWRAGGGQQKTDDLLRELVRWAERQWNEQQKLNEKMPPLGDGAPLPK